MGAQPKIRREQQKRLVSFTRANRTRGALHGLWISNEVSQAIRRTETGPRRRRTILDDNAIETLTNHDHEETLNNHHNHNSGETVSKTASNRERLGAGVSEMSIDTGISSTTTANGLVPALQVEGVQIPHFLRVDFARWLLRSDSNGITVIRQLKYDPHISGALPHLQELFPFVVDVLKKFGPETFFRLLICICVPGRRLKDEHKEIEITKIVQLARSKGLLALLATSASFLLVLKQRGVLGSVMRLVCRQRRLGLFVASRKRLLATGPLPITTTLTDQNYSLLKASVAQAKRQLDEMLVKTLL